MREESILELSQCRQITQTLQAGPPRIVRGTMILLALVLGVAFAWSASSKVDLVVKATGRVRPLTSPRKELNAVGVGNVSARIGGQVVEVNFHEGQEVKEGDVLVRLNTERVENELAKWRRTLQAKREEVEKLKRLQGLMSEQYLASKAKAEAELAEVEEEIRRLKQRRAVDVRLAELQLRKAQEEEERARKLVEKEVLPRVDLEKATAQRREAGEKLQKARISVDESRLQSVQRGLDLVEKDAALKREELEIRLSGSRGDLAAARRELANLVLEKEQAVLRAHTDGVVTAGDVKVGDILEAGKPVVAIAQQKGFSIELPVPSGDVGMLKVGMKARVKLDAYDYQRYGTMEGTVYYISPDSTVVEGPGGTRIVTYQVKLSLDGEEVGRDELRGRVKLGMTGQVEIVTDQQSILSLLLKKIRGTISLS